MCAPLARARRVVSTPRACARGRPDPPGPIAHPDPLPTPGTHTLSHIPRTWLPQSVCTTSLSRCCTPCGDFCASSISVSPISP